MIFNLSNSYIFWIITNNIRTLGVVNFVLYHNCEGEVFAIVDE